MSKKYEELVKSLLLKVGGEENIKTVTHCATRLRFTFQNDELVDKEGIRKLKGVAGVQTARDQFHVVIGPQVEDVYKDFISIANVEGSGEIDENLDKNKNLDKNTKKEKLTIKSFFNNIFNVLGGTIIPIFPIFIGAGLIKMLVAILGPDLLNLFAAESDVLILLNLVGDAGFYFFPLFAAWSAAKLFKTSIPLALFISSILIHPTLIEMTAAGDTFSAFGIPVYLTDYANQFLPSILMVWILSYVYSFLNKKIPDSMRMAFVPVITVLIMVPITLTILGPLAAGAGVVIGQIAAWLANTVGPLAVGLIGGLWYFLVALGMDKALLPIVLNSFADLGYDNLFWLSAVVATYSLIGVSVAFLIRSKKEDRAEAGANAITLSLGGVSEPTIYGIIFQFKKAAVYLFLGGLAGGVIASILNVKAYVIGAGNLLFFTVFAGGDGSSLIPGIISCVVAFAVSCTLGLIFGFYDKSKKIKEK